MKTYRDFGFIRVAAAVPTLKVADCKFNSDEIIKLVSNAEEKNIQIIVFPELSITGYTCADLFHQKILQDSAMEQLKIIAQKTTDLSVVVIVGVPVKADDQLFNCAAVIQKGLILGIVPKTFIPGYREFYEERWFSSGRQVKSSELNICGQTVPFGTDLLFESQTKEICFGIEICEDLWTPVPPSSQMATAGASVLFNLSASNDLTGKVDYRRNLIKQQSGRCIAAYIFSSAGIGESSTDLVFGGHSIIAENGVILAESERFARTSQLTITEIDVQRLQSDRCKNTGFMEDATQKRFRKCGFEEGQCIDGKLIRSFEARPFVPAAMHERDERCREIFSIQTAALAKRIEHTGLKKAVIGISGGLDSTLALLVTEKTFELLGIPNTEIIAITMPGFGTSGQTYQNAIQLIKSTGADLRCIDIKEACIQHFRDIGHDPAIHDTTYENVQARERTQILMDIANRQNGLVIGTGDLSELALGWCTYNGDHMSMYSVNCGIPKTLVRYLVEWVAKHVSDKETGNLLKRILETPISPELLPLNAKGEIEQKTEDVVGPYELHDFFLYHTIRYGASPEKVLYLANVAFAGLYGSDVVKKWLVVFYRRFFSQQFKRSCVPDGPKVGSVSLSPRGDWRMPSDASAEVWLSSLEQLEL